MFDEETFICEIFFAFLFAKFLLLFFLEIFAFSYFAKRDYCFFHSKVLSEKENHFTQIFTLFACERSAKKGDFFTERFFLLA